jgi:hypothetical protein
VRPRRDGSGRVELAPAVTSGDLLLDLAARLEAGGMPLATDEEYATWRAGLPPGAVPYLADDVPLAMRRYQARESVEIMTPALVARLMGVAIEAGTPEAEVLAVHVAALRERQDLIRQYKLESLLGGVAPPSPMADGTPHPPVSTAEGDAPPGPAVRLRTLDEALADFTSEDDADR